MHRAQHQVRILPTKEEFPAACVPDELMHRILCTVVTRTQRWPDNPSASCKASSTCIAKAWKVERSEGPQLTPPHLQVKSRGIESRNLETEWLWCCRSRLGVWKFDFGNNNSYRSADLSCLLSKCLALKPKEQLRLINGCPKLSFIRDGRDRAMRSTRFCQYPEA